MDAPPAAAPDLLGPQLRMATRTGNVAQVRALLDQGADIEARGQHGWNALHWASEEGHREVVALLVDRGGDIEAVTATGSTPVMIASSNDRLEIVQLLHARGANIHHARTNGENALHVAARWDHLPVCEFLLSKGLDLMAADNHGETALSCYGGSAGPALSPETKALRCAALVTAREAYWRERDAARSNTIDAKDSENARLSAVTQTNASLLFSDAFSDLVFVCPGGERIHAHRCIVSAGSTYARVLLQGPWAENKDERVAVVQMPQSAAAVRALLRFLYTGEPDAAGMEASMSGVLELASQHEQPALKAACERHAMAALSVATVVPVLVAAHLHELAALKAACVALIVTNIVPVSHSKAYMRLETTHPLLWREMRAALGLPEEEEEEKEEEEDDEEEEQDRKRARHEN